MVRSNKGISFIEVMIVVAIVAILAAIAYPSYQRYKVNANRADVQSELLRVAQKMQSYRIANHTYSGATLSGIGGTANYPAGKAYYSISLAVDADSQGYVLLATPVSTTMQAGNGLLCINQDAQKLWTAATACTPTSATNWDSK